MHLLEVRERVQPVVDVCQVDAMRQKLCFEPANLLPAPCDDVVDRAAADCEGGEVRGMRGEVLELMPRDTSAMALEKSVDILASGSSTEVACV